MYLRTLKAARSAKMFWEEIFMPKSQLGGILYIFPPGSLAEFDPLSAAGPDGIRPVMLQKAWETINAAYTNIAKASYRTSHTPVCWRNATGIFLPKPGKGDYYNPKSYRTISLSPVPLKWM